MLRQSERRLCMCTLCHLERENFIFFNGKFKMAKVDTRERASADTLHENAELSSRSAAAGACWACCCRASGSRVCSKWTGRGRTDRAGTICWVGRPHIPATGRSPCKSGAGRGRGLGMRQVRQEQLPQKRKMLRVCSAQAPLRGHQHCCGRAGSAGTDGPAGRDRAWTSHCARRGLEVELARGQAGPRMVACRAADDGRSPAASTGAAAATPWRWRADGAWGYSAAASGTSWRWRTTRAAPPCCHASPRPCRAGMHCSGSTGGHDHGYGSGSNRRDASTGPCHATTKSGVARFRHAGGRSRRSPTG